MQKDLESLIAEFNEGIRAARVIGEMLPKIASPIGPPEDYLHVRGGFGSMLSFEAYDEMRGNMRKLYAPQFWGAESISKFMFANIGKSFCRVNWDVAGECDYDRDAYKIRCRARFYIHRDIFHDLNNHRGLWKLVHHELSPLYYTRPIATVSEDHWRENLEKEYERFQQDPENYTQESFDF